MLMKVKDENVAKFIQNVQMTPDYLESQNSSTIQLKTHSMFQALSINEVQDTFQTCHFLVTGLEKLPLQFNSEAFATVVRPGATVQIIGQFYWYNKSTLCLSVDVHQISLLKTVAGSPSKARSRTSLMLKIRHLLLKNSQGV